MASDDNSLALQADLNAVYSWTTENNMELNGDKFECLPYGTNRELQNNTSYKSNSESTIQEKDSVKDMGITMSNDATFKVHIRNAITEGQRQCTWILRTFSTRHLTNADTVEIISPELARLLQPTMVPLDKRRHPGSWNDPETIPAQDLKYAESVILAAAETTTAFLSRTKKRERPNYLYLAQPGRSSAKYKHSWTDIQDNSHVTPTLRKGMSHTYSEKDCSPWCKETLLCQFACTWTATLQHSTCWHPRYVTV